MAFSEFNCVLIPLQKQSCPFLTWEIVAKLWNMSSCFAEDLLGKHSNVKNIKWISPFSETSKVLCHQKLCFFRKKQSDGPHLNILSLCLSLGWRGCQEEFYISDAPFLALEYLLSLLSRHLAGLQGYKLWSFSFCILEPF